MSTCSLKSENKCNLSIKLLQTVQLFSVILLRTHRTRTLFDVPAAILSIVRDAWQFHARNHPFITLHIGVQTPLYEMIPLKTNRNKCFDAMQKFLKSNFTQTHKLPSSVSLQMLLRGIIFLK